MPITVRSGINPQTMVTNWSAGVGRSGSKWASGALNPRRLFNADPTGSAASWQSGVSNAAPAYAAGLQNTDLNAMANNITNVGVSRYQQSGTSKVAKYQAGTAKSIAATQAGLAAIANMPRGKGANNIARSQAFLAASRNAAQQNK